MSFIKPNKDIFIKGPSLTTGANKITNQDFADWIGSTIKPSLLEKRTGIAERYWASKEQAVTDLAFDSVENLKNSFKASLENVGVLVFSTISSDYPVPPSAPLLQDKLGLRNIGSFDLAAACAGFTTGLINSVALNQSFNKDILLCSSEIRSKFLDKENFQTAVLFGDGASSCLITQEKSGSQFRFDSGQLFSEGEVADIISIPHGGSRTPYSEAEEFYPYLTMKGGAELYIKALDGMYQSSKELLASSEIDLSQIDWVVPHQANLHMIKGLAQKLEFPLEKVVQTVKKYGNTSGASVGMALNELVNEFPIESGQKVLLVSAGGGGLAANAILEVL